MDDSQHVGSKPPRGVAALRTVTLTRRVNLQCGPIGPRRTSLLHFLELGVDHVVIGGLGV
jgi:hypothetical protein